MSLNGAHNLKYNSVQKTLGAIFHLSKLFLKPVEDCAFK